MRADSVLAIWEHVFVSMKSEQMEKLGDQIATLASHISAATARWLLLIAEFDDGTGWSDGGYKNCAHWLSWRCGIAPGTARDHVRVAHGLKQRPLIAASFERGELSYSKVRALLRLDDSYSEEQLLEYAQAASAGQLERIVRGCRKVESVQGGAARQFAERELSWSYDDDGSVLLHGRLPAEIGAVVVRAIEAARDQLGPPPPEVPEGLDGFAADEYSSPRARNADALVALAESSLAERVSTADTYQVVVHVDVDALGVSAETSDGCRLEDGEPLPSTAARRLTCDGSIVRVLERDGKTISIGRKTRTIPPAMRRALRMRDLGCKFPGCTQRFHMDGHHLEHWADGGETELENLVQLCRFHHRLMHEGGFTVRLLGDDNFEFCSPNGEVIPQAPRLPRGDCRTLVASNAQRRVRATPVALWPPHSAGENVDLSWSVEALADSRMRE
jgi:hypothetical protein